MNLPFSFILFLSLYGQTVVHAYRTSYSFMTRFKTKTEIDKFISSPKFYDEYFKLINAEKVTMGDALNDIHYDMTEMPQRFTYYAKPRLSFLPECFPKIKIEQFWCKDDYDYFGHIKTKYMEFGLIVEPIKHYDTEYYGFYIEATLFKKYKKIVPNKCLDYVLKDFCQNFVLISNTIDI